ncbi:MAG: three-Cys-motif partner protein TcmP [Candidatus Nealsonbacteria bacterium]|nr:three-Cys-motif partner protein TcmP [Candidatus Nealsonbacteria bacterium]
MVEKDDGLPTRPAGHWTQDKLYFWNGYVHITTMAMVGKPTWPGGIIYVDLFGGPGICTLKSGRRMPGSPLIAAYARKPFTKIIVCEKDEELAESCRTRLTATPARDQSSVLHGDCNELVHEVVEMIPDGALTLAFIDPTGLHAKWETIRALSAGRQVDLLVLFADRQDIVRNIELYYKQGEDSNLDQVLGSGSGWRDVWNQMSTWQPAHICEKLAELYKGQLSRRLGYEAFAEEIMSSARTPLYRLIFASKHRLGLDFWQKATKKYASGQMQFDF